MARSARASARSAGYPKPATSSASRSPPPTSTATGATTCSWGRRYEDLSGLTDTGYAQVIWGAPEGPGTGPASRSLTQTTLGEALHAGDQLGCSVDVMDDVTQGDA